MGAQREDGCLPAGDGRLRRTQPQRHLHLRLAASRTARKSISAVGPSQSVVFWCGRLSRLTHLLMKHEFWLSRWPPYAISLKVKYFNVHNLRRKGHRQELPQSLCVLTSLDVISKILTLPPLGWALSGKVKARAWLCSSDLLRSAFLQTVTRDLRLQPPLLL